MGVPFGLENFKKLQEHIYRKAGIALEYDKHYGKLEKLFHKRCEFHGYSSFRKYYFHLRFEDTEGLEFQELINGVTVNETYFFRESHQFEAMIEDTIPQLHKSKPSDQPIRILVAPTATGEEAYSIAIYLLEDTNGIVNERDFEIVALDIDSDAIKKAREGLYTNRSIHAIPEHIKTQYFRRQGLYNKILDDLRDAIAFDVGNVFDRSAMKSLGKFDIIFSRNMLIYFDDASKKEVAMTFYEMMNPGASIFLGHAEYMNRITPVFKPRKYKTHMYYQK